MVNNILKGTLPLNTISYFMAFSSICKEGSELSQILHRVVGYLWGLVSVYIAAAY